MSCKRLHIKRCRTTQGPKGKVAQAFQEDEEAEAKVEIDFSYCCMDCIGECEGEGERNEEEAGSGKLDEGDLAWQYLVLHPSHGEHHERGD